MNLQARLAQIAHKIWNSKGIFSTLLLPLSWITGLVIRRKAARYRRQPGLVWHAPVPVVIVGNIYVGGTGKTPVVMALIDALIKRGWHPGVISRGYGIDVGSRARCGCGELDPSLFGDEPALIARSTGAPVAVHPSRPKAARALLRKHPQIDIIVADDGLQHLALGRDAEIIVQDGRGTGNGRLLPAGPLREPASRLEDVDVIVSNQPAASTQAPRYASDPAAGNGTASVTASVTQNIRKPLLVRMALLPHEVVHLGSGTRRDWDSWLTRYSKTPVSAVAAIGHPERFFSMLVHEGQTLAQTRALPDHTRFQATSFEGLETEIILITTKDAVKCEKLDDDRLWAVHVTPQFSDTHWLESLHATLLTASRRKNADHAPHSTLN